MLYMLTAILYRWIAPPTIVNALYYPPLNKIGIMFELQIQYIIHSVKLHTIVYCVVFILSAEFEEGILNNPFIMAGWPS